MQIDIIFATNSSGTHEAARTMEQELLSLGHRVNVESARLVDPNRIGQADLTILGSCTWERFENKQRQEGQLQQHMQKLVDELSSKKFTKKKFAIYALGDSSYTNFANAAVHLENFLKKTGGQQVGASLRVDGWFFNLEENRERVREWVRGLS